MSTGATAKPKAAVAREARVSRTTVYRVEVWRQKCGPRLDTLRALAAARGMSLGNYLLLLGGVP